MSARLLARVRAAGPFVAAGAAAGPEVQPGRRKFLGCAGLSVAAAVAAAMGPGSRSFASLLRPAAVSATSPAAPLAPTVPSAGDWQVDDMWGPRYAQPVPYLHVAEAPDYSAHVAPGDRNFVI